MIKHTPGSWFTVQKAKNHHHLWTRAYPGLIADIHNDRDAALIAAAPELLAALQELDCAVRQFTNADESDWPELVAARAAIAKATGEQQ